MLESNRDGAAPPTSSAAGGATAIADEPAITPLISGRRIRGFEALSFREFRLIWLGQVTTAMGQWMDQVARGWLMYDLTGSPFHLGLLGAMRLLPLLFLTPIAGTLADRAGRKTQLILAQSINAVANLALGMVILSGDVHAWHVYATGLVTSIVQVFQVPVRHALVPESVDRVHLTNAISLNSLAFNVSRSVGPATAGGLIAVVGAGGSYLAQAMIFALSTLWTVQLRLPNQPPGSEDHLQGRQPTIWRSTLEGWRYVLDHATIRTGLIVSAVVSFFGMSSSTLLPVFAKDVLQGGPTAQGLLLGAAGVGAVASAMFVAVIGDQLPKGTLMIGGVVAYGLSTLAFSASHWLGVSILLMLVTGACNVACTTVIQTVLQGHAAPPMRGRVMAVYQQHHILIAGGGLLAGAVATVFGAPLTVGMLGTACVLGALAMYFAVPLVRTLR